MKEPEMIMAATEMDDTERATVEIQQARIIEFLRFEFKEAEERDECFAGAVIIDFMKKATGWTDEQVQTILNR